MSTSDIYGVLWRSAAQAITCTCTEYGDQCYQVASIFGWKGFADNQNFSGTYVGFNKGKYISYLNNYSSEWSYFAQICQKDTIAIEWSIRFNHLLQEMTKCSTVWSNGYLWLLHLFVPTQVLLLWPALQQETLTESLDSAELTSFYSGFQDYSLH